MSYILDALRRSQAERERGQVPGLGAQPVAAASSLVQRRLPPGLWLLVGASVLVLLAGAAAVSAWWARGAAAPAQLTAAAPGAGSTAATVPMTAVPSPAPRGGAATPATTVPTAQFPTVVSAPPTVAPTARQAASLAQSGGAGSRATSSAAAAGPAAPTTVPAAAAGPATAGPIGPINTAAAPVATTPAEARAIPLSQLSAEQRRDLPPLVVSGSIWSDSPASRFVMINGQVVREGDSVAPGLKLERIAPKAAVLRWRDMRIEIGL